MAKPAVAAKPEAPKPQASVIPKSAGTVTVACKVPTGVVIQLCRKTEYAEETMQGTRMRVRYDRYGPIVIVRGPAQPAGTAPRGYVRPVVVGGYALTPGVDADFWKAWLEQNKDSPLVLSGQIFAHGTTASTRAQAQEQREVTSGLEPLNMDGDPRMPKPATGSVTGIETADEFAGRTNPALEDA